MSASDRSIPDVCLYLMARGIYSRDRLRAAGCRAVEGIPSLAKREPGMIEEAQARIRELYTAERARLSDLDAKYHRLLDLNPKLSTSMDWDVPAKLFKEGQLSRVMRCF